VELKLAEKEFVEKCTPLEVTVEEAKDFVENVIPKMEEMIKEKGLGIAAPQIGIEKKFFIAKDLKTNKFYPYFNAYYFRGNGSRVKMEEGCLSYPNNGNNIVKRFKSIKMFYQRFENDKLINEVKNIKGDQAIVFQHECDHIADKPKTIFTK